MTNKDQNDREYITTPEAADRAGLTKNYIALLARQGKLDGFRVGQAREWFIYADSLEDFLKMHRKPGPKGSRKNPATESI